MTIKVNFFAALREQLNCSEMQLTISAPLSVEQAKQLIISQQPQWSAILTNGSLLSAVNHDIVDDDFIVSPNDELAFFPPVTGG